MVDFRRRLLSSKWLHLPVLAILSMYFVLVTIYSLATPLLEAPDAYFHFSMIEYIGRTGHRPTPDDARNQPWEQMVFHAPLYYQTSAILISPINTDDFLTDYPRNPHAQIGEPHASHNRNFVAHAGDKWSKTGLAIRMVRLYSMLLGAITLISLYALVRYAIPSNPYFALMAMLVVLFNPQFLFMQGVVSNDNLVTTLTTVGLCLAVRVVRLGITWQRVVVIAVILALNSIAKVSGNTLYPAVAIVLTWLTWRDHRSIRMMVIYALIGLIAWAVIAGWWYWDNYQQFDDPFAARFVAETTGSRTGDIDYSNELRGLYYSFWGLFGWFNIIAPSNFYDWVTVLIVLSGVGMLLALRRTKWTTDNAVIAIFLIVFVSTFLWSWRQFMTWVVAGQGRLWFPMLGVIVLLLAVGLSKLPSLLSKVLIGGMATATVAFPFLLIYPTYRPNPQLPLEAWSPPTEAAVFSLREPWNNKTCLNLWVNQVLVDTDSRYVDVSIAWQATCPITGYWSRFIHLSNLTVETCEAGDTRHILAQFDTMPDGGNLPLPAFKVGYVFEENIRVEVPDSVEFNRITHLQLGLYDANGTFVRMIIEDAQHTEGIDFKRCGAPDAVNAELP